MEDKNLLRLANIAIVRQHINHIVNSGVDRKAINPIQKIGRELDEEFVKLLLKTPEKVEIINSISVESTTFENLDIKNNNSSNFIKYGDTNDLDPFTENTLINKNSMDEGEPKIPSETRPKFKTSKKAAKK